MSSSSVVVVVVAWNCIEDIAACLSCLEANTTSSDCRVVVIDNASTDGSREWLIENSHRGFELILADRNLGWVGALNLALRSCSADYLFFLNPDAFVSPGWLEPLVAALDGDPSAGFASPKFCYPNGLLHYAGAYLARSGGVRVLGHDEQDGPQHNRQREVPFGHGQCLVRTSMTRDIGFYDDGFGIGYYEEIDYQLRARRQGWRTLYVPASVVIHATGSAFKKHPGGFKEELMIRNWLRVITLHWPLSSLVWRLPLELFRPLRAVKAGDDPRPILRAWRGWLSTVPEIIERRREIGRLGNEIDFTALHRAT